MMNNQSPLNRREREELLRFVTGQVNTGPKSSEVKQNTVQDRKGAIDGLGAEFEEVQVDDFGTPQVTSEVRGQIMDCGHALRSPGDLLGKCSYGHLICHRHELRLCDGGCGKIICYLEWEKNKYGEFRCRECRGELILGLLAMAVILAIVLYFIF